MNDAIKNNMKVVFYILARSVLGSIETFSNERLHSTELIHSLQREVLILTVMFANVF